MVTVFREVVYCRLHKVSLQNESVYPTCCFKLVSSAKVNLTKCFFLAKIRSLNALVSKRKKLRNGLLENNTSHFSKLSTPLEVHK
jgi:hypothetical protein